MSAQLQQGEKTKRITIKNAPEGVEYGNQEYDVIQDHIDAVKNAFLSGQLPEVISKVFINLKHQKPMANWSFNNNFNIMFLSWLTGKPATDVRGWKQWEEVGRNVDEDALQHPIFFILAPLKARKSFKLDENGNKIPKRNKKGEIIKTKNGKTVYDMKEGALIGFVAVPVWDISDTTGEPLEEDDELNGWVNELPLKNVSDALGVEIVLYDGEGHRAYGWNEIGTHRIGLGVQEEVTWFHELVHEAEQLLGVLTRGGQEPIAETVAEFSAATLCSIYGIDYDMRFSHDYIERYAATNNMNLDTVIRWSYGRIVNAISFLLNIDSFLSSGGRMSEDELKRIVREVKYGKYGK